MDSWNDGRFPLLFWLDRMFRPPGLQRWVWSSWLWIPLSLVTIFDTSGNAATWTEKKQWMEWGLFWRRSSSEKLRTSIFLRSWSRRMECWGHMCWMIVAVSCHLSSCVLCSLMKCCMLFLSWPCFCISTELSVKHQSPKQRNRFFFWLGNFMLRATAPMALNMETCLLFYQCPWSGSPWWSCLDS